jgi:phage terminase large subunit
MRTSNACFIDFNPDDDEVWINTKLEQERASKIGDVEVIVSTFRDNAFLPRSIVDELLNLRITDPDLWQVYGN